MARFFYNENGKLHECEETDSRKKQVLIDVSEYYGLLNSERIARDRMKKNIKTDEIRCPVFTVISSGMKPFDGDSGSGYITIIQTELGYDASDEALDTRFRRWWADHCEDELKPYRNLTYKKLYTRHLVEIRVYHKHEFYPEYRPNGKIDQADF